MILPIVYRERAKEYALPQADKEFIASLTDYELSLLIGSDKIEVPRQLSVAFSKKLSILSTIASQNEKDMTDLMEDTPDFNMSVDELTGQVSALIASGLSLVDKMNLACELVNGEDVNLMLISHALDLNDMYPNKLMETRFNMRVKSSLVRLFTHLDDVYHSFINQAKKDRVSRVHSSVGYDVESGKELVNELDQDLFSVKDNLIVSLAGLDVGYQKHLSSNYSQV